jgi:protoporphyrin/coproporphyrin ferrochelatase
MANGYDAILVVSFGGPERREDVIPFLENVLRGKPVPRERMLEVAEHYYHFGGASPINEHIRELIAALREELRSHGLTLPIYWGNRNWHPMLADTMQQMQADGRRKALAFVTSTFSCYSGCRQYREDIASARNQVGEAGPIVDKIRVFYNHPGFVQAQADRVRAALAQVPSAERPQTWLYFTAHSIPTAMADNCDYVKQLSESCRLVSESLEHEKFRLVYQSRSGPPSQPWLEPDVCDAIDELHQNESPRHLVLVPIGFLSDHLEVMYDLDIEAAEACRQRGIQMVRAETVGTHPRFIRMIRELIQERIDPDATRLAVGRYGPNHDVCPQDCCLYSPGRPPIANRSGF